MIGGTLQVGVLIQHVVVDVQEELQRVLVQEVNLGGSRVTIRMCLGPQLGNRAAVPMASPASGTP